MFDENEEGIRQGKAQSSTKAPDKCKIYEENENLSYNELTNFVKNIDFTNKTTVIIKQKWEIISFSFCLKYDKMKV